MAYYDALKTKWPTLTGTTAQKIAQVNALTTTGAAMPMIIPTYKIYNLIVSTEFSAITAANQQLVRDILSMGTVDASPGTQIRARIVALFPSGTTTFANLAALAATFDTPTVNWCGFNGYPVDGSSGNLSVNDATAAGLV